MALTQADADRERRISNLAEQMLAAPSIDVRRARMAMMLGEIKSRSPNAIAYLERERGLV